MLTWRKHIFHTSPLGPALRPQVHDQTAVPFPQRMYTCWSGLKPVWSGTPCLVLARTEIAWLQTAKEIDIHEISIGTLDIFIQ